VLFRRPQRRQKESAMQKPPTPATQDAASLSLGLSDASEILQLAAHVEGIGKIFYESLALGAGPGPVSELSRRLAQAEEQHRVVFTRMLAKVFRPGVDVRLSEARLEQAARQARQSIVPDPEAVHRVALAGKLKEAVEMAMQMEKSAIRFYGDLRPILVNAQATLDDLIKQEQGHLRALMALRV